MGETGEMSVGGPAVVAFDKVLVSSSNAPQMSVMQILGVRTPVLKGQVSKGSQRCYHRVLVSSYRLSTVTMPLVETV